MKQQPLLGLDASAVWDGVAARWGAWNPAGLG